jgi:hypothetical protein
VETQRPLPRKVGGASIPSELRFPFGIDRESCWRAQVTRYPAAGLASLPRPGFRPWTVTRSGRFVRNRGLCGGVPVLSALLLRHTGPRS